MRSVCRTQERHSRQRSASAVLIVLLFVSLTTVVVEGFLATTPELRVPHISMRSNKQGSTSLPLLRATTEDDQRTKETWSASSGTASKTSRFGVRKRVRAVLEKAKNRTGVRNINSDSENPSVIAEAASIGALDFDSNLVMRPSTSSNGAAIKTNGASKTNGFTISAAPRAYPRNSTDTQLFLESAVPTAVSSRGELNTAQVDAMLNSNLAEEPLEPLPFTLPTITKEQRQLLADGERIQEQSKMGREGSGYVVLDVKAPPYVVWECLLDFEAYPELIGTVRSMSMFTNTHLKSSYIAEKPVLPGTGRETRHYGNASITRARFVLSKFRLAIAAIHKYRPHPEGHYMVFTLDRACTNYVLQDAKGIWYTESNPDGRGEEYTRVWLLCEVQVSPVLPSFIVDYAAKKAMPRATSWLKPEVEAAAKKWGI